jgi:hypothetical protein
VGHPPPRWRCNQAVPYSLVHARAFAASNRLGGVFLDGGEWTIQKGKISQKQKNVIPSYTITSLIVSKRAIKKIYEIN